MQSLTLEQLKEQIKRAVLKFFKLYSRIPKTPQEALDPKKRNAKHQYAAFSTQKKTKRNKQPSGVSVWAGDGQSFQVCGAMTLAGKTKQQCFKATIVSRTKTSMTLKASAILDRTRYGIANKFFINRFIDKQINVSASIYLTKDNGTKEPVSRATSTVTP